MTSSPKVLVIDDDCAVLSATAMSLRYSGCTVLTANSPEQALAAWGDQGETIDAVIADLDLRSSITGEQLCDMLRTEEPNLLTILLTGHSVGPRRFGRIDGLTFFQKPYDVVALSRAVKEQFLVAEAEPGGSPEEFAVTA
jgi:DNA-binding NtrC family response regulator